MSMFGMNRFGLGLNKRGDLTMFGHSRSQLSSNPGAARMMIRMGLASKLHTFKTPELKELCRAANVKASGTKDAMISRLRAYRHTASPPTCRSVANMNVEEMLEVKKAELKQACIIRGVAKSGNVRSLIIRILTSDNAAVVAAEVAAKEAAKQAKLAAKQAKLAARQAKSRGKRKAGSSSGGTGAGSAAGPSSKRAKHGTPQTPGLMLSPAAAPPASVEPERFHIESLLTARKISVVGTTDELKARLVKVLSNELV